MARGNSKGNRTPFPIFVSMRAERIRSLTLQCATTLFDDGASELNAAYFHAVGSRPFGVDVCYIRAGAPGWEGKAFGNIPTGRADTNHCWWPAWARTGITQDSANVYASLQMASISNHRNRTRMSMHMNHI